ncbi:TonB-dependent receptor [Chitinophaga sedimenti]|uniref:TonB-dependent receptor n=1 Tax=Chitinophaga sedimenti TaxID=2033606 RepID=UPI00200553A1|nr:TonB-dependent receptor [Chitinophaga sedimenti]MCK7557399.1 TonB-dependent receptor [Chitinophaga sedimenti]
MTRPGVSVTGGFLQANYGRTWDRHELNIVPGATIEHNGSILNGYRVEGFPIGNFTSPAYGANYPEDQYPSYSKTERRAISGFLNVHYGLDRKYLADVTYRRDGSSVFGSTRRFTDTGQLAWAGTCTMKTGLKIPNTARSTS